MLYKHVKHQETSKDFMKFFLEFLFEKVLCLVLQPTKTLHKWTPHHSSCVDRNNSGLF